MTASKVDLMATRSSHSNRWCNVQEVQRTAAPRVTRRCLFGQPDQDELQKIWKGNLETERQRMLNKYGFDVKTEKYVGHGTLASGDTKNCTGASRLCNINKKTSDHKPYKQTCMTGMINVTFTQLNFNYLINS